MTLNDSINIVLVALSICVLFGFGGICFAIWIFCRHIKQTVDLALIENKERREYVSLAAKVKEQQIETARKQVDLNIKQQQEHTQQSYPDEWGDYSGNIRGAPLEEVS